ATAYQTLDVITAVERDTGEKLQQLRVDGGMTVNNKLMQFQSDILDVVVQRSADIETTARGAAYAAGLGVGAWDDIAQIRDLWQGGGGGYARVEQQQGQRVIAGGHAGSDHEIGWTDAERSAKKKKNTKLIIDLTM